MHQRHGTMFTKLDLIERIISTTDEKVLAKVGDLWANEQGEFAFTKEHLALLEERRERRRQGLFARRGKDHAQGYAEMKVRQLELRDEAWLECATVSNSLPVLSDQIP